MSICKLFAIDTRMEKLYSKRPLKDIALRRVAILLCSQPNVHSFVAKMKNECKAKQLTAIDGVIKEVLTAHSLPASTKEEVATLMKYLIREVIKWLYFHEEFLGSKNSNLRDIEVMKHICWERYDVGTISYRKTAVALIHHEKLNIDQRYMLACLYCLEQDVRDLWKKVPKKSKKSFYNYPCPLSAKKSEIVVFWTCIIEGRADELCSVFRQQGRPHFSNYYSAFEFAAVHGYRTATQYFFEKLKSREKEILLMRTVRSVADKRSFDKCTYLHEYQKYSDVLCYFLTKMRHHQRISILKSHPCEYLKCLLDWPRQDFFLGLAKLAFPYLSKEDYSRLLFILARNSSSGYNYSKLFREFFLISPRRFKNYTLAQYGHFLREFFRIGDVGTIKFIFEDLKAEEKVELAFTSVGIYLCFDLIHQDEQHLLDVYVRELKLSPGNKKRFIDFFTPHGRIPPAKLLMLRRLVKEVQADSAGEASNSRVLNEMRLSHPKEEPSATPTKRQKKV